MQSDQVLDCKGLSCPMPIMKLAITMKKFETDKILELLTTDPGSKEDVPAWCERTGNDLLETVEEGDGFAFFIRKG